MTVQSMLDNLAMFYSNFIETREMPSGRRFYYLNGRVQEALAEGHAGDAGDGGKGGVPAKAR